MIEEFWSDDGGFYLGSDKSEQLIVRSMTGYDGAIPSGNSIAAYNLLKLTRLTGEVKFAELADKIFKVFSNEINNSPTGYTSILSAFMFELSITMFSKAAYPALEARVTWAHAQG